MNEKISPVTSNEQGKELHLSRRLIVMALVYAFLIMGCGIFEACSILHGRGYSETNFESHISSALATNQIYVWLDFGATGIISPTESVTQLVTSPLQPGGTVIIPISLVNELSDKGYLAVRVPHAPPTYTQSSIISATIDFTYREPPDAADQTTVPVTVTQRNEYLAAVNARYPITDGKSHWEVWWLPEGERFPLPNGAFRLEGGWPTALEIFFVLDFGTGVPGVNCAGCPVEVLLYNGYTYIGPFTYPLVIEEDPPPAGNPLVAFGPRCGALSTVQTITPTVPFTHTHWLESYDTVGRTFTITASSSQNWDYMYYTKRPNQSELVPVAGVPFTVTMGPRPNDWPFADCIGIMAVNTPTISIIDTLRETFAITATSVISPDVQATNRSFALAPSYQLNEGAAQRWHLFLPVLMK